MIASYDDKKDVWGLPQTYKGINFYPIKLMDIEYLDLLHMLFAHPKNYIPDATIVKMSYIKFLLFIIKSIGEDSTQDSLTQFLRYCTRTDSVVVQFRLLGETMDVNNIVVEIVIDDVIFSEHEFSIMREIILRQNGLNADYIEEYNPELENKLALIHKDSNQISFGDEIFIFCALTNQLIGDVKDYTLYQFKAHFERVAVLNEFNLYKPLEASGQIKLKNGGEIKHYLSAIEKKGRYADLMIDKQAYVDQNKDVLNL